MDVIQSAKQRGKETAPQGALMPVMIPAVHCVRHWLQWRSVLCPCWMCGHIHTYHQYIHIVLLSLWYTLADRESMLNFHSLIRNFHFRLIRFIRSFYLSFSINPIHSIIHNFNHSIHSRFHSQFLDSTILINTIPSVIRNFIHSIHSQFRSIRFIHPINLIPRRSFANRVLAHDFSRMSTLGSTSGVRKFIWLMIILFIPESASEFGVSYTLLVIGEQSRCDRRFAIRFLSFRHGRSWKFNRR